MSPDTQIKIRHGLAQFGDVPHVEVYVRGVNYQWGRNGVEVNWSCTGSMSVTEATKFLKHFQRAIKFARKHAKRLKTK